MSRKRRPTPRLHSEAIGEMTLPAASPTDIEAVSQDGTVHQISDDANISSATLAERLAILRSAGSLIVVACRACVDDDQTPIVFSPADPLERLIEHAQATHDTTLPHLTLIAWCSNCEEQMMTHDGSEPMYGRPVERFHCPGCTRIVAMRAR